MHQFDTHIGPLDDAALSIPVQVPTRVVVQSGRFQGVECELVQRLSSERALVRVQRGVLIEIDTSVLGECGAPL